jgi:hypothetical protein
MREVKIGGERDLNGIYGQPCLHAELTFKVSCGWQSRAESGRRIFLFYFHNAETDAWLLSKFITNTKSWL